MKIALLSVMVSSQFLSGETNGKHDIKNQENLEMVFRPTFGL
jgi:hypothetical protein